MLHHTSCLKLLAYYHLKTKYENQQIPKTENKILESSVMIKNYKWKFEKLP